MVARASTLNAYRSSASSTIQLRPGLHHRQIAHRAGQILVAQLATDSRGDQHIARMGDLDQRGGPVYTLHDADPLTCDLPERAQEGPHVVAALQCLDQGGADHDTVDVRGKARDLCARTDAEPRAYRNRRAALDAIHVIEHLVRHLSRSPQGVPVVPVIVTA